MKNTLIDIEHNDQIEIKKYIREKGNYFMKITQLIATKRLFRAKDRRLKKFNKYKKKILDC